MSDPVDRNLIEELLKDESLSYREIARRANCSDWSARQIARDLAGEPRAARRKRSSRRRDADDETTEAAGWGALAVIAAVLGTLVWLAIGRSPPPT